MGCLGLLYAKIRLCQTQKKKSRSSIVRMLYLLIFLGMLFEGDLFLFTSFFLARTGVFNLGYLIIICFVGAFLGDLGWRALGRHRFPIFTRVYPWVERLTKPFANHLLNRPLRTLAISKFTYGLHRAVLIRSGMLPIPLGEFIKDDLLAIWLWGLPIALVGYFSGHLFFLIRYYLRYAEISLVLALVLFYLVSHYLSAMSRQKL